MSIDRGRATRPDESSISSSALIMQRDSSRTWRVLLLTLLTLSLPTAGWSEESPPQVAAKPLLVDDAVATAVDNNPSLAEMQSRYEALAEIPSQLGTLPDPVLNLNSLNLPMDTFSVSQEAMTQMQIGISQVMPFPGKLALKEGASEYEAAAAGNSVDEMRLLLISSTKSDWWRLYYLDRALDVVASNQDLLRQFIQVAKTKYEVGEGLQQDTLLAQLELSKLFDQEIRLEAFRRNQAIQLNVLMDTPPDQEIVLPGKVSTYMPDLINENTLYQRAELIRPLLKAKENYINAAQSRLELAKKEYYPDFKLGLAYGNRSGENPFPRSDPRADFLSVMFSVNLPIYRKRKLDRAVGQRSLEVRKSRDSLRDKWTEVRSQISTASTDYLEARDLFSLFDTGIIPQARQTVSSMLAGYQVSEVDFLNLVDSQITLLNYEVQYWKALTDARQALARLVAAVGEEKVNE
jgi:outer membrane protein, heavy metal efflux system